MIDRCKQCERTSVGSGESGAWGSRGGGAASPRGHTERRRASGAVPPHPESTLGSNSGETRTHTHQPGALTHKLDGCHACGEWMSGVKESTDKLGKFKV